MPLAISALGAVREYTPMRTESIASVTGTPIAELSLVPAVWAGMQLRALSPVRRSLAERSDLFKRAADIFTSAKIGGMYYQQYRSNVSEISGLPISIVESATDVIAEAMAGALDSAYAAMPRDACRSWTEAETIDGRAVWTRKGGTLGVNAAGNHPGVHTLWLEALALGYAVAVRPSRREPLTPHRMVSALRTAGLSGNELQYIPGGQDIADILVAATDFAVAYGGEEVKTKFGANPRVLVQGPGRSKIAVADDLTDDVLATVVSSVADQGGAACINATAFYCANDHLGAAQRLADQLRQIPHLPPADRAAQLPCAETSVALGLQKAVRQAAGNATPVLGADEMLRPVAGGYTALCPTVYVCDSADAPQANVELPFPCVWVLPWPERNSEPLANSLVVTAVDAPDVLVESLVEDPSVRNVYRGAVPTHWMRLGLPHDGYLAEFLMESKTVNAGSAD